MNKILEAIEKFSITLGEFKSEISKILKEISDKKEELNSIMEAQIARTKDLDIREVEIKKIEDIVALKESTQILIKQSEKAAQELLEAQRAFEADIIKKNKEIADAQKKNETIRLANENESNALIKLRKDLEAEKENYKLRIARGMTDLADKIKI